MKLSRLRLLVGMMVKFGVGFFIVGALLFSSAGSFLFTKGWILIATLATPITIFGLFLLVKEPATLQRRLKSEESQKPQRLVIASSGIMFILSFAVAGFDYRYGWSAAPMAVTYAALALLLAGYGMFIAVILQNSYASRVVEVTKEQALITSGLYSLVRHPMYTASLLIFLAMPLVLGSYYALLPMLVYPFLIVKRIGNEEKLLSEQLPGYTQYMEKTSYRLLPFVW